MKVEGKIASMRCKNCGVQINDDEANESFKSAGILLCKMCYKIYKKWEVV